MSNRVIPIDVRLAIIATDVPSRDAMLLRMGIAALLNTLESPQPTLADIIAHHATQQPDAIAFIEPGAQVTRHLTWDQYHRWSNALALSLIDRRYDRGERIGILLPDGIDVHIAFVACEKAGLVAVGISARAGEREIAHVLRTSGAVALLSLSERQGAAVQPLYQSLRLEVPTLRDWFELVDQAYDHIGLDGIAYPMTVCDRLPAFIADLRFAAGELFLINSTSGTTGMPKCVAHNQQRWFRFVDYVQDSASLSADDVFLCAVPASVGFGLWFGHFTATVLGATTILLPKFSIDALAEALMTYRVTVLAAVSTQLIMLLNAIEAGQFQCNSLRILYTGGEAVPFERAARFEALTGATVLQFYGSNEAGGLSYTTCLDSQEIRLRTAGRIIPAMQVRLVDPETGLPAAGSGRPICQGPLASLGYFNDEAANQRLYTDDGFVKMDDIVRIDDHGYLTVVGRIGDFIIRGGKNISAAAVEEGALTHPAVTGAAAVAMPDPVFGERVCLYATVRDQDSLALVDLTEFLLASGISKENCPERLIVVEALPQVSGGKVAKQALRDDIRRRLASE